MGNMLYSLRSNWQWVQNGMRWFNPLITWGSGRWMADVPAMCPIGRLAALIKHWALMEWSKNMIITLIGCAHRACLASIKRHTRPVAHAQKYAQLLLQTNVVARAHPNKLVFQNWNVRTLTEEGKFYHATKRVIRMCICPHGRHNELVAPTLDVFFWRTGTFHADYFQV
jgi:hypothetical protein